MPFHKHFLPFFRLILVVMLAMAAHQPQLVLAQEAIDAQQAAYDQVEQDIAATSNNLADLTKKVDEANGDDTKLADIKQKAEAVAKTGLDIGVSLQPRYSLINKRLTELGDPPAANAPAEDPQLAADRTKLIAEKAQINALTSDAETLATKAGDLANRITAIRRDVFAETLLGHTDLTVDMAAETGGAFVTEAAQLVRIVTSSAKFVWNFKRSQLLAALALSLISALILVRGAYRMFDPLIRRERSEENPAYITRLTLAFWSTVLPTISITIFVVSILFFLLYFNVLRQDIATIVDGLLTVFLGVYFIWRLSRAVVAPGKPQWRLINVSDQGARLLVSFAVIMALVNGVDYLLESITAVLDSPVVLTVGKSLAASVVIGLLLLGLSFIRPMNDAKTVSGNESRPWPKPIRFGLRIGGVLLIVTALSGYVGLARFVSTQIVITGAILITMYIGFLSGRAVSHSGAFANTVAGRYLTKRFDYSDVRLEQIGLAAGLGIYAIVFLIGLPLILLQWGFQVRDIQGMAVKLFTDIRIGNITISLVGVLGGFFIFALGLVLSRGFQRWLDGNVMVRSHVDSGVRNSVNTVVSYIGIAIAVLLGVSAAGIDLSSFALVAGALSLGIGFGLQNIVSNFVSGLILLAERPFKVGDWVVTGNYEGFVKRISVRATEIETFQQQSIIVPNAELINASLGNWTLRNKLGRSEVSVGVSYDSDPRKVMDILMEIGKSHKLVLKTPEPSVAFLGFGDSSLNFELRVFLADLLNGVGVRNDLRLAVFERFKAEGIEIPFPQRDVNIHFKDDPAGQAQGTEGEAVPPAVAARLAGAAEKRRKTMQARLRDNDTGSDDEQ